MVSIYARKLVYVANEILNFVKNLTRTYVRDERTAEDGEGTRGEAF